MTAYLTINKDKRDALKVTRRAAEILLKAGAALVADDDCAPLAQEGLALAILPENDAYRRCDMVVSIGGDGTLLRAARQSLEVQSPKPLLGINIGRLGFLTMLESDELDNLRRLVNGDYLVEMRSVLLAQVQRAGSVRLTENCLALNDVVLFKNKPEKTISLDIYCDGISVSRFRGDGVIFATPAGSTAYNLSAGGPIVDARLGAIVVTQICAHIVQTPPMVFAQDRVLKAVPTQQNEEVYMSCDGTDSIVVRCGETVCITQSDSSVPLIQFNAAEQLEAIDKKLKGR